MTIPLRVLVLEGSPTDAEVMLDHLGQARYALDWWRVETEADYLANLESTLDLILLDYTLPDFTGRRALQLLQDRRLDVPAHGPGAGELRSPVYPASQVIFEFSISASEGGVYLLGGYCAGHRCASLAKQPTLLCFFGLCKR